MEWERHVAELTAEGNDEFNLKCKLLSFNL